MKCDEMIEKLELLSPPGFACEWDNVGLMTGSRKDEISKILVVLDCDDEAIDYAVANKVDLIVSHHPLIFGGLKKVNDETLTGRRVVKLIRNGIAEYSMHTNFDIKGGMASLAAERIGMDKAFILEPCCENEGLGRWGNFPEKTVLEWADKVKTAFGLPSVNVFGDLSKRVTKVAIAPGSGKEAVMAAVALGVELVITGDVGHHTGTDAAAQGCMVIDAGHYGLEHIFIEFIGGYLKENVECEVLTMAKKLPCTVI